MGKYDSEVALVRQLLAESGSTFTATRETSSAVYDVVTGTSPKVVETIIGVGVITSFKKSDIGGLNGNSGFGDDPILSTDKKFLFSGPLLKTGDLIGNFRVYGVVDINPDGSQTVLQICRIRV